MEYKSKLTEAMHYVEDIEGSMNREQIEHLSKLAWVATDKAEAMMIGDLKDWSVSS